MTVKKILIAGAGTGIGEALLSELKEKKDCFSIGISRRGIPKKEEPFKDGKNYLCDLLNPEEILTFINSLKNSWESLDALYLTFGNGLFKPIQEISLEDWENHFRLNLNASFILLKALYPLLKRSNSSFVSFLSSTAGKMGFPDSTAYCASRHAIAGFAKALREEWKKDGIRVFTVYPGAIATGIWEDREGFSRKDMILPGEFARFLASFIDLAPSINLDEVFVLPPKGIL
jgi:NAD(P)-dependent dehydrogenase (short-subunit alcohol dehydrogenase family)